MKIAFLALFETFDYFQIGGTDSYMRRLTWGILDNHSDIEVTWVLYGASTDSEVEHRRRFKSLYFRTFRDALSCIAEGRFEHVVAAYLRPSDRLRFWTFRKQFSSIRFYSLVFFYPSSNLQRLLKFSEYVWAPYSGCVLCVSQRQVRYLRRLGIKAHYLPPIVPHRYFVDPLAKPQQEVVNITFLGRIDPRKGIHRVIDLFQQLSDNHRYKPSIYGIHIPDDRDALEIHNFLKAQKKIRYVEVERRRYSPLVDTMVREILKSTDIFVQPYVTLDSTVDTPILLLESMASSCAVLTCPVGDVASIYGASKFLIGQEDFLQKASVLLNGLSDQDLRDEQRRVNKKIVSMEITSKPVVKRFLSIIGSSIQI